MTDKIRFAFEEREQFYSFINPNGMKEGEIMNEAHVSVQEREKVMRSLK